MWILWLFLLFSPTVFAGDFLRLSTSEGYRDLKSGPLLALGLNQTSYTLYQDFKGTSKTLKDEGLTLNGPTGILGYDWNPTSWFVLGLRGEGNYSKLISRKTFSDSETKSTIAGQLQSFALAVRAGICFELSTKDVKAGVNISSLIEVFMELGRGIVDANFDSEYRYVSGADNDLYSVKVKEQIQSNVLSGGINFSSREGGFLEIKFSQMSIATDKVKISGNSLTGGQANNVNLSLNNANSSPIYVGSLLLGYHW